MPQINQDRSPQGVYVRSPQGVRGSGGLIKAKSWCYVDSGSPAATLGLNTALKWQVGSACVLATLASGDYDGSTGIPNQKAIINFERAVNVTKRNNGYRPLLALGAEDTTGRVQFTISSGSFPLSLGVAFLLRLRPITAPFVTASQNYSNLGSLTLGTSLGTFSFALNAGDANSGVYSSQEPINDITIKTAFGMLSFPYNNLNFNLYGLLLDVGILWSAAGNTPPIASVSTATATGGATIPGDLKEPFFLPGDAE